MSVLRLRHVSFVPSHLRRGTRPYCCMALYFQIEKGGKEMEVGYIDRFYIDIFY